MITESCQTYGEVTEALAGVAGMLLKLPPGRRGPLARCALSFAPNPPWPYQNEASRAAAINHYRTMSIEDICCEPVNELVEDSAHLHLWTTNAFLREAFEVIDAWGFQYKSC